MARSKTNKKKTFINKPNKALLAGSSNNLYTHKKAEFILRVEPRARRGGSALLGFENNYCLQLLPLKPRSIVIILLSFNYVLKKSSQIGEVRKFTLRVGNLEI